MSFVKSVSLGEIIKTVSVDRAEVQGWNCELSTLRGDETEAANEAEE